MSRSTGWLSRMRSVPDRVTKAALSPQLRVLGELVNGTFDLVRTLRPPLPRSPPGSTRQTACQ